jgi:hypothetical protein
MKTIPGHGRSLRAGRRRGYHRRSGIHCRRLTCEALEDRRLLSIGADLGTLLGMRLVDPSVSRFDGQVVYLDFDGAKDVIYDGPVRVGPFDIPAFKAPGPLAGQEPEIIAASVSMLNRLFSGVGVAFTAACAERPPECSTVYVGAAGAAFGKYGSFDGLAEKVDAGNHDRADSAFVFSDSLIDQPGGTARAAISITRIVAHEVGHLLGYGHTLVSPCPSSGPLAAVAHASGPDDGGSEYEEGLVHQYLTNQAFQFFQLQFSGSELSGYLGTWTDWTNHYRTNGDDNDVVEGSFDEDVSDSIWPVYDGFHKDIHPQNPFNQDYPFYRHFAHGADVIGGVDGLSWGLDDWWIPGSDQGYPPGVASYFSAWQQAEHYWNGWGTFTGLAARYQSGQKASAYYYLGHVAHLLEDMTVPAHVHGDEHALSPDSYERSMGVCDNYQLWGVDGNVRASPMGSVSLPVSLQDLFRVTADYTEEYDSNDVWGDDESGIPNTGRHRPDLVSSAGGFTGDNTDLDVTTPPNEITVLGDDLMPFAIEKTAALYRLFYSAVDATWPVVSLPGFSTDVANPTYRSASSFSVSASASDAESGVDVDGYHFQIADWSGFSWSDWRDLGASTSTRTIEALSDGLHAICVSAENGGGLVGWSTAGYFVVDTAGDAITGLEAKTSSSGSPIAEGVWQTDNDPYFYWDQPSSTAPIVGYSFSLDAQPDHTVDTADTYYQYPPDALGNGTHFFYVVAEDAAGNWSGGPASFIILVDDSPPTAEVIDVSPDPRITAVDKISIVFSEAITGFDLGDLTLARDGGGNPLAGSAATLTKVDDVTWELGNLSALTRKAGAYVLTLSAAGSGITDLADNPLSADATDAWLTNSTIAGRRLFCNNSKFDGNDPAANAADDGAIDPAKQALLPGGGKATFANYTSFSRGLNGIMIDVGGLPVSTLAASDFTFRYGNDDTPSDWLLASDPTSITERPGAGTGGSDRISLIWPNNAIPNANWLQVTVLASAHTGLAANDVFYFGSAIGETGNSTADAKVNSQDVTRIRNNYTGFGSVGIESVYDINRDRKVNSQDVTVCRNYFNGFGGLKLIMPPAAAPSPASDRALLAAGAAGPSARSSQASQALANAVVGQDGIDWRLFQAFLDFTWTSESDRGQPKQKSSESAAASQALFDQMFADYGR